MQSGPIEPGSIRELIVAKHWVNQQLSELNAIIAIIQGVNGSEEATETLQKYISLKMPFASKASPRRVEEMKQALDSWVSKGAIQIPDTAIPNGGLKVQNRAVRKFAESNWRKKLGRRSTQVPDRGRSPAG